MHDRDPKLLVVGYRLVKDLSFDLFSKHKFNLQHAIPFDWLSPNELYLPYVYLYVRI